MLNLATSILCIFTVGFISVASGYDWGEVSPLDDYVWRDVDDDAYSYELEAEYAGDGYTMRVYNLTSQRWLNETFVVEEDTWWRHWFTIVIPDDVRVPDAGLLNIMGGNKNDSAPVPEDTQAQRLIKFTVDTGAVSAEITNVPHQPTRFADDEIGRIEDQIIARTWRWYIEGVLYDPDVIVLNPMVRAARRAVDTMIDVANEVNPEIEITQILPTGRSKRGWTAWLLSCVDTRVFALSPVVFDLLNWHPNLHHHWQAYGGWSFAFQPYTFEDLPQYINDSRTFEIFEEIAIDPLVYNTRLADRPKLITIASGDEFFLPDDSYYFWDTLQGVNYLQMMENAAHSLDPHNDRYWRNLGSFFMAAKYNTASFPVMEWSRDEDDTSGSLTLTVDRAPISVRGWIADTTNHTVEIDEDGNELHRRDFRLQTLSVPRENTIEWVETPVDVIDELNYSLEFDKREAGYRGFLIEMTFPGPFPDDPNFDEFNFTTEMQVLPDVLPFPRCSTPEECSGPLK